MKKVKFLTLILSVALIAVSCGDGGNSNISLSLIPYESSGGEEGYFASDGKIVINPQFSSTSVFREGLALVSQGWGKCGFIDEEGKFVINAQYYYATVFNEGLAWVVPEKSSPVAINKKGEIKISLPDAQSVRIFREGLAAYTIKDKEGTYKAGFVDKKGNVVINPQFSNVGYFSEGLCAVRSDEGKWGYIDTKGNIVINPQFNEAGEFKDGLAVVEFDYKAGLIDKDGKYIINPQYYEMAADGNMFMFTQDYKIGWCDKTGKIIINPQFEEALPFAGGDLAAVMIGEKVGYIDKSGKIIINPQFDGGMPFSSGNALVVVGDKIGLIDKNGKYLVNPQFDNVPDDLVEFLTKGETDYESVVTAYVPSNN